VAVEGLRLCHVRRVRHELANGLLHGRISGLESFFRISFVHK
jgi:hypothetical protein